MQNIKLGLIGIIGTETEADLWGTMKKVADIGYKGIEGGPMQLLEGNVADNVKRFNELGLQVITVGAFLDDINERLDLMISNAHALKAPHVTVWQIPSDNRDELLRTAEIFDKVGKRLTAEGLKLCFHNHEFEFNNVHNGVCALDILAEHTDPKSLYFELDVAWATFAGEDPVMILKKMKGRIPSIHIKDLYRLDERDHFTSVGTGMVKVKETVEAAIDTGVEWVVLEQDRLRNLSAFETINFSYLYLKEAGFIV